MLLNAHFVRLAGRSRHHLDVVGTSADNPLPFADFVLYSGEEVQGVAEGAGVGAMAGAGALGADVAVGVGVFG